MRLFQKSITTSTYRLNGMDVKIYTITKGLISINNNFLEKKYFLNFTIMQGLNKMIMPACTTTFFL